MNSENEHLCTSVFSLKLTLSLDQIPYSLLSHQLWSVARKQRGVAEGCQAGEQPAWRTQGEKLLDMTSHLDLRITRHTRCFQRQKASCISIQHIFRVHTNLLFFLGVSIIRYGIKGTLYSILYPMIYVLYGRMFHLFGGVI